jgi:ribose/xylose/arabinose/galactoside ABC-type transport system permease subunit
VGSVFAAGGLAAAALSLHGASPVVALVGGVAVGAGIGLINGLVIVAFRIPALIVTLGMTYIARGLAEVLTQAQLVPITDTGFTRFGEGTVGIVPIVVFYGIGIGVLAHIVLEYTRFGYLVRAVGGNAGAARSVGIKVSRVQVGLYVISGAAAGLSGTFTAARLHAGDPNIAIGYELTVLSAVIIGGTSLFGGVGTILGTALGAILLSAMTNGLIVINLNPLWQNVAVGVVIIAAVGIDQWRRRKSLRRGVDDEDDGLGAQFEGAVEPAVASS